MAASYGTQLAKRTENSLLYRVVHRVFYSYLTPSGRGLFWLFCFSTSVSLFSFVVKAYLLWCAIIALIAVSVVFSRLARVKLKVHVDLPERVRCDQEFRIELSAHNKTRRQARDLRLHFQLPRGLKQRHEVGYLSTLAPGQEHAFQQRVIPTRRGAYIFDTLLQETCYPFGLWRDHTRHSFEQTVLVYPRYRHLRELEVPVGMRYQPGGLALTSYLGDSTEFLSTREFRLGDPLRHIHWRSWARLGKPIVKEYGEEYFCRLALLIDTVLPDPADPIPLERAVSLSASITEYLSRQEYVIDLFAAGPKLYYLQAGRSLAYLQNIMDVLACLEATPPDDESFLEMETALLEEIEGISTAICVFTDWDLRRQRLVEELQNRGTVVRGFYISADDRLVGDLPDTVRWLTPELVESGIDVL